MRKLLYYFLAFSIISFLGSCRAKKKTVSKKTRNEVVKPKKEVVDNTQVKPAETFSEKSDISTEDYVKQYAPIAITQMKIHKIPASITLAQGILESRSGNSDLTAVSNNHFGIKCHKGWDGMRTFYNDDKEGECFRVYNDPMESFNDHSKFLTQRSRYQNLFTLPISDYKAWAHGLKKAGYATDKKYAHKLIKLIEKYNLHQYDLQSGLIDKKPFNNKKEKEAINQVYPDFYIVQKGDGLYKISKLYNTDVQTLMDINDLEDTNIYPGQHIYLKPKNIKQEVVEIQEIKSDTIPPVATKPDLKEPEEKPAAKQDSIVNSKPTFHIVRPGEKLYAIAYQYNLEIPDIRKWNGIKKDEIRVGQKLYLSDPNTSITSVEQPISSHTHTVKKGETLYSISRMYDMEINELRRKNNLSDNTIFVGQELKVK